VCERVRGRKTRSAIAERGLGQVRNSARNTADFHGNFARCPIDLWHEQTYLLP